MTARPTDAALALATIAYHAGEILLRHYAVEDLETRRKEDHSPVTDADEEAEAYIQRELGVHAPGVPSIAEEEVAGGRITVIGRRFFLVDPLDGTKEFINKNG
jgi:3'(2'), 5'-bisphosphate nucleotidase